MTGQMGYSRISVKCLHCGANQTRKSRAGLFFRCRKCGKVNPGPAVSSAVLQRGSATTSEPVDAAGSSHTHPTNAPPEAVKVPAHTVSGPAAPTVVPAKKAPAKAPSRASKPPAPRPAAPRTTAPQPPREAPAKPGPGFLDRLLYGS